LVDALCCPIEYYGVVLSLRDVVLGSGVVGDFSSAASIVGRGSRGEASEGLCASHFCGVVEVEVVWYIRSCGCEEERRGLVRFCCGRDYQALLLSCQSSEESARMFDFVHLLISRAPIRSAADLVFVAHSVSEGHTPHVPPFSHPANNLCTGYHQEIHLLLTISHPPAHALFTSARHPFLQITYTNIHPSSTIHHHLLHNIFSQTTTSLRKCPFLQLHPRSKPTGAAATTTTKKLPARTEPEQTHSWRMAHHPRRQTHRAHMTLL
jgi:hypothetical protein